MRSENEFKWNGVMRLGDRGLGGGREGVIIRALSLPFTRNLFPRSRSRRVTVHSRNRLNRYRPCAIMRAKCPIEVNNVFHNGDGAYMMGTRGGTAVKEIGYDVAL